MNRWLKVLIAIAVVLALCVAGLFITRAVNQQRYYTPPKGGDSSYLDFDYRDASAYPLDNVEGVTITPIKGEHMAGFHLKPDTITRPGVTIAYGGSEGGAGLKEAVVAAQMGQESMAMFFWGQPNQTETLRLVPLDDFQEVLDWANANIKTPEPIIAAGGSKGAEYVANLLPRYPEIDHAFLVAPASYSFPALSQEVASSWSYKGEPVPFLAWDSHPDTGRFFFFNMVNSWLNVPSRFTELYALLLENPSEDARIRIEDSKATIHAVTGEEDGVWPSAMMAQQLKDTAPEQVTVTVYPKVGHAPGAPRYVIGLDLGGSDEANLAVKDDLAKVTTEQFQAWTSEGN